MRARLTERMRKRESIGNVRREFDPSWPSNPSRLAEAANTCGLEALPPGCVRCARVARVSEPQTPAWIVGHTIDRGIGAVGLRDGQIASDDHAREVIPPCGRRGHCSNFARSAGLRPGAI